MAYRRTERVIQRLNARRDSVVAAAHEIAAEVGLDAVQIVPVAARAGIAAGTVYRYFPAKTDLVAALIEGVTAQETAAITRAAAAAPGPLSALAAGIVTFAARAVRQRRLIWAVLAAAGRSRDRRICASHRSQSAGRRIRAADRGRGRRRASAGTGWRACRGRGGRRAAGRTGRAAGAGRGRRAERRAMPCRR